MRVPYSLLVTTGLLFGLSNQGQAAPVAPPLRLHPGYVYKLICSGKLLVSAVGNENLVRLEAIPREIGCGALLKPVAPSGATNLILETSTGTVARAIEVVPSSTRPDARDLEITLQSGGAP